jgi:glucosamine--fructose-6-phosphate aminotransferase (isomerizing)
MTGTMMASEMAAQPAILDALVARRAEISRVVRAVVPHHLSGITLVARGSSDNAAVYGRYLLEMAAGRPAALAAPSVHTVYGSAVDYSGYLAIGLSQSGRTPEIIDVLAAMRRQGARTIAIVNDDDSPLRDAADAAIDIGAGVEEAVPATKSFTATLLAVALVADALGPAPWPDGALQNLPAQVDLILRDAPAVDPVARAFDGCDHLLVTARGLLLVAALETALKIRETSAVLAEAMSSADLRHGPIAAVGAGHPVVAITGAQTHEDIEDVVTMLRGRGAVVRTVSVAPDADIALPTAVPEQLLPIVASVRGQQIAARMAAQRNLDPDRPGGLSKVTPTY